MSLHAWLVTFLVVRSPCLLEWRLERADSDLPGASSNPPAITGNFVLVGSVLVWLVGGRLENSGVKRLETWKR